MSKDNRKFDIEERLIDFAVRIIRTAESLPKTKAGNHIAGQLTRCGTSPAPNYGEAQSAESIANFIHKMKICLKELRETKVWLLMITRAHLIKPKLKLKPIVDENNELIAIFVKRIQTAKQNQGKNHNSIFDIRYSIFYTYLKMKVVVCFKIY
jgi:four helix bundle protein